MEGKFSIAVMEFLEGNPGIDKIFFILEKCGIDMYNYNV